MTQKNAFCLAEEDPVSKMNLIYKENLLFYEKIFSSLNAIVFVFDVNNLKMLWTNDAFKKILGYKKSSQKIPESVLAEIYHPDDRDFINEMKGFFKEDKNGTFTAIIKFRDVHNKYIWLCTACNIYRKNDCAGIYEIVGVSISFSNNIAFDRNLTAIAREKIKENNRQKINQLSRRELQLIKHFAKGQTTKNIATDIGISSHTVNNHRKNILKKLGYNNIASLVCFAIENGLN